MNAVKTWTIIIINLVKTWTIKQYKIWILLLSNYPVDVAFAVTHIRPLRKEAHTLGSTWPLSSCFSCAMRIEFCPSLIHWTAVDHHTDKYTRCFRHQLPSLPIVTASLLMQLNSIVNSWSSIQDTNFRKKWVDWKPEKILEDLQPILIRLLYHEYLI